MPSPSSGSAGAGVRELGARTPLLLVGASAAAFYAVFIARSAFHIGGRLYFSLFDDAMISMRFAKNLANGHGLVWNPGEHPVEGYTNPLWTLWMAFLHVVRLPTPIISLGVMVTGALLLLANVAVVAAITRRLSSSRLPIIIAASFTAFYYPLVYWTLRGMEVGLLALLVSLAILLALRLRAAARKLDLALLAVVLAAGVLTRTDALVPLAVVVVWAIARAPRGVRFAQLAVLGGTLVGTVAANTAFRLAYYGLPFPNTYYLKVLGFPLPDRLYRGAVGLATLELSHLWAPTILIAAYLVVTRARVPAGTFLLLAVFGSSCAYSLYVGGDAWEWMLYSNRYIAPTVPGLLIVAALAVDALRRFEVGRLPRMLVGAACVACFLLTLWSWLPLDRIQMQDGTWKSIPVQLLGPVLATAYVAFPRNEAARLEPRVRTAAAIFVALLCWLAVNGLPATQWVFTRGAFVDADANLARYGVALRQVTAPTASIAVVTAGAPSYFSDRRAIDLLGKSDHFVATRPPTTKLFYPGHDKWDYRYSIGRLRPDLVAQIRYPTATDLRLLSAWGYVALVRGVFVRRGDDSVEVPATLRVAKRFSSLTSGQQAR